MMTGKLTTNFKVAYGVGQAYVGVTFPVAIIWHVLLFENCICRSATLRKNTASHWVS